VEAAAAVHITLAKNTLAELYFICILEAMGYNTV
jgi:hypothetical protein